MLRSIFLLVAALVVVVLPSEALQLAPLLSTCVDACQRGCVEIRKVQRDRINNIYGGEDSVGLEYKDDEDSRSALTRADLAAQEAIIGSLRAQWGAELNIVGEEDGNEQLEQENKGQYEPLKLDMFEDDIGETPELDPSAVTIFVDPLDGTREFVEGRLENCQVLVGIAIDGEAVAGAIGLPFPTGQLEGDNDDEENESTIIYGLADIGTGTIGKTLTRGPFPLNKYVNALKYPPPHYATGDSPVPVMRESVEGIIGRYGGSNVVYGGAGNKILGAALGEVACSIQHKYGGPWDLCAPEAILKAMGGRLTDLFGKDIDIYRKDAPSNCNERGYIATGSGSDHDALVEALSEMSIIQDYKEKVQKEETEGKVLVQSTE
ncbi:unnamed protein product [Cylindrotheca closterium]|uniref:3'(2'),5'-bisphosphate nucleotidase 1 n=1 Tax=Cylindrotheca closterium TaxID=2856 RepID=A0AAD2FWW9_9STRA|nr:unnamed protein product [Cylindrotheca closterium]